MVKLYEHQKQVLKETENKNKVLYAMDMGTGKTYVASEKATQYLNPIFVICQKSKIKDWVDHYKNNYPEYTVNDLSTKKGYEAFRARPYNVGVINYDLVFRRNLKTIPPVTLILDESSLIQNPQSKRYKAISKLNYANVIMLSGTCCNGYYHTLWTQCRLLGWRIRKGEFENRYVKFRTIENKFCSYPIKIPCGCKNEEHLKQYMKRLGTVFMKTEDVMTLPEQREITVPVNPAKAYREMEKNGITTYNDKKFVGDMPLTKLLSLRQLAGINKEKPLKDLLDSTSERVVIFYNFNFELDIIKKAAKDRPISLVNGDKRDLTNYETKDNAVTIVQYQAGSMGLNLQKAHIMILFSPTCKCDDYMQAKKRIHRIGQEQKCIYYRLVCGIENKIYSVIEKKQDFILKLFENM